MEKVFILIVSVFLATSVLFAQNDYSIILHGGAGFLKKENLSENDKSLYEKKLEEAIQAGEEILKNEGSSLDAVKKVINILEDSPLFNAGKGSVFTHDKKNEMDASVMDGKTLNAGAVAGVKDIKNPINAAIEVMNKSKHVMLSGDGASEFAKMQNLKIVDPSYFYTEDNYKYLEKILKEEDHGTVGCVAIDKSGNITAGTSTGGMTNKKFGRIGDSPIIGAGTYANNLTCGVSCTGHGEFFIRNVVAYDISALMMYRNVSLKQAATIVIEEKLTDLGGYGGVIAIDKDGNIVSEFNTTSMFRAYTKDDTEISIEIF